MRSLILLLALLLPAMGTEQLPPLRDDAVYQQALDRVLESPMPGEPETACAHLCMLADVAFDARRYDLAETAMRNALIYAPDDPGVYSNLSVMLGKQARFVEAAAAAKKALALDPTWLHAQLVLPSWQLCLGEREAALAAFAAGEMPADAEDQRL